MPASFTSLPATGSRSSLFLDTVSPLLTPRVTVDFDSFPTFQGAWREAQGWALPLPPPSGQGNWPASHGRVISVSLPFLEILLAGVPARWVGPRGSEDWLGIATPPTPSGNSATEGLCAGVGRASFSALGKPKALLRSVFTHSQMGGLGRVPFWVVLYILGCWEPSAPRPTLTWTGWGQ